MVAAALGQMIEDEQEREVARGILADEIRGRLQTSREDFNVFKVDDGTREVLVYAVTYGGGDWIKRSRSRG